MFSSILEEVKIKHALKVEEKLLMYSHVRLSMIMQGFARRSRYRRTKYFKLMIITIKLTTLITY